MKKTMKKKNTHNPDADAGGQPAPEVCLEFTHPTAAAVCVAGTFNEWRPEATPMISVGNGRWIKQLVLPPGSYEYCLVVDGEWMPDPLAKETAPNPFGGLNSVLQVAASG
jgi:1,4-alpha-glucan branching enzyme